MAKLSRNFIAGRMNKVVDERLLPDGEYIDAMNIRMGSTEKSEVGVIENSKGNISLTTLSFAGTQLSVNARCIGAIDDSANETLYWFVHDPEFPDGETGKIDLIVSYNVVNGTLTYNVISTDDGAGVNTTLNFDPAYLITGVNIIEDLLFFTDDYNPPRFINVKKNYPNPNSTTFIDGITAEEILVIKKPPTESPFVQPIVTGGEENYMDTRFISFAYRYRYENGEYSATSQWSQVSFVPNQFSFSVNSMLNEGMSNACNGAIIEYNSGGPLVVAIDLLFKQSANNVIKVIETLDKKILGLSPNTTYQYTFTNSKIFTILPDSEILRLYDNVPRLAKAQTIMGNRLMYGNYVEGYDLVDKSGIPIRLEYSTSLITEPIGSSDIDERTATGNYNVNSFQSIPNSVLFIDLNGKQLKKGSAISVQFNFSHNSFSGGTPPAETTDTITLEFSFFLTKDYTSVHQLATSPEFQSAVGTTLNIKPVYSATPGTQTSCDGSTFTDRLNCIIPNTLDSLTKISSGITLQGQPIAIIASPGSSEIGFQLIAMKFVDNLTTPTQSVYEYYSITFAEATFQEIANPQSLHSNRGYEVGIIYMDDFNRSSTALVSPNNTEYIPCGFSANKNGIRVTIPPTQIAPYWATRYKFVIKPDSENYEVIYTNLFFTDPNTNEVWFFLEGENTKKVEVGDRLIVKADTSGPLTNCAYATVLDKVSQQAGFIDPEGDFPVPAGVYMKINPNSFSAILDPEATVAFGREQSCAPKGGNYSRLSYLVNKEDPDTPGSYIDISIPAGSRINFLLDWSRIGVGSACEKRGYKVEKVLTSSADYDNFEDWFRGDNVEIVLTQGVSVDGITTAEFLPINGILSTYSFDVMYVQFYRDPVSLALFLQLSTGLSCTGSGFPNSRQYCAAADITVFRAIDTISFETEPTDALPDVFYENNLSFSIDSNGNHMGNVVNQNIASGISGVVDTEFFNCFAFGNGAESYKIRDSIIGRSFTLGERVTSTSAQDYKEADRFADITYSGVFNAETNVNKLNEFNAGLLNYKNLEVSFGPIFILDGRETDVLALQEEKVSYVLAGKNLLSDSTGGGAVASVPEVLGTQIARNEKYGISFNPESYIQWGFNRFFTDVKRGAVIQLIGDSYSSEQLKVISEANMRTWFRDEFNEFFNTQKLGGFDPYMNEYVLTSNNIDIPLTKECIECGITQTINLSQPAPLGTISKKYCYALGNIIGETSISWTPISNTGGNFQIKAKYNGTTYSSPVDDVAGTLTFDKDQILANEVEVEIIFTSAALSLELTIDCPTPQELTIVQIVLTNNYELGKSIHTQYRYTFGSFTGPLLSNYVIFGSGPTVPVVSRYDTIVGFEGQGAFPPGGSTLTMRTNKTVSDTFVFNPLTDKFRYARKNILYPNTQLGINTLLAVSSIASPISGADTTFEASFTVPSNTNGEYLYLIWDLRDAVSTELCYSSASAILPQKKSCCACDKCNSTCVSVEIVNTSEINGAEVYFPLGRTESCGTPSSTPLSIELDPGETFTTCLSYDDGLPFTVISGTASVEVVSCTCD